LARERKVYIESQSRRVLERRGVDTRDGVEGAVDGRRVGEEEVRGLEGIAGALGMGGGRDRDRDRGGEKEQGEDEPEVMDTS
jgi:kinetochore protein Mis12/MTW1